MKPSSRRVAGAAAQRIYSDPRLRGAPAGIEGADTISWRLKVDTRKLAQGGDKEARCRKCHTRIVLLPDDHRQGYCFDCYDPLEVLSPARF